LNFADVSLLSADASYATSVAGWREEEEEEAAAQQRFIMAVLWQVAVSFSNRNL
jgi:hypothetical protein